MSKKEKYIPTNDLLRKLKKIRNEKKIDIDPRIFNAIKDLGVDSNYIYDKEKSGCWIVTDILFDSNPFYVPDMVIVCSKCKTKKIIKYSNDAKEFCDKCGAHNKDIMYYDKLKTLDDVILAKGDDK